MCRYFFLFGFTSVRAWAAVPVEVTAALTDMKTDTMIIAVAFVVIAIIVAAFMWLRRPAGVDLDDFMPCAGCGEVRHVDAFDENGMCAECHDYTKDEGNCANCGQTVLEHDVNEHGLCGDCLHALLDSEEQANESNDQHQCVNCGEWFLLEDMANDHVCDECANGLQDGEEMQCDLCGAWVMDSEITQETEGENVVQVCRSCSSK